jgi:uncharacterized protein
MISPGWIGDGQSPASSDRSIIQSCQNSSKKVYLIYLLGKVYIAVTCMEFEFDEYKSASNKEKHGINFIEAQKLWLDIDRLEVAARLEGEPRFLVIGQLNSKHWAAVITYRRERVRIISVRRARNEEVELYESGRI